MNCETKIPRPKNTRNKTIHEWNKMDAHCTPILKNNSAHSIHLQQAVVAFNSQVSLPNAISVSFVLASPSPTQKVLSGMIEDQLFANLMDSSSHANRARLLSVAAPHSSSWLSAVPSTSLGLHLETNEYWMAIKWWLVQDTSGRSMCPFCTLYYPRSSWSSCCDLQAWGRFCHTPQSLAG